MYDSWDVAKRERAEHIYGCQLKCRMHRKHEYSEGKEYTMEEARHRPDYYRGKDRELGWQKMKEAIYQLNVLHWVATTRDAEDCNIRLSNYSEDFVSN